MVAGPSSMVTLQRMDTWYPRSVRLIKLRPREINAQTTHNANQFQKLTIATSSEVPIENHPRKR